MLAHAIGTLASIGSIAVYLTCLPVCWRILKKGSTGDVSFFPFVVMFCSATLWFKYGLFKNDNTLVFVNGSGAALTLFYTVVYYINSTNKPLLHKQLVFGSLLLFPVLIYLRYYATDRDDALFNMGLFCSMVGILSYGSPLAAVKEVFRSKSTSCMTFSLSLGNFIVAFEWLAYGYLVGDLFIQVPNFVGLILGAFQLLLFLKYPSQLKTKTMTPAAVDHKL